MFVSEVFNVTFALDDDLVSEIIISGKMTLKSFMGTLNVSKQYVFL